jgi:hypothetical protein
VVLTDRVGQLLHQDGLAGFGRGHDEGALSLTQRAQQVDHPHRQVPVLSFQPDPGVGIAGPEVVEGDPVLGLLRLLEVDLLDFEQRQVPLSFLGRPNLTHHGIAGAQIKPLDLAGRDVDVIGSVQVIPVLAAQEAVALGQDLEHALTPDDGVRVQQGLLDPEDQILLSETGIVRDVQLFGQGVELSDRLLL